MANEVETYLIEKKIPFTSVRLPVEEQELTEVPKDAEKIFKTLVLKGDKTGVVIALVPWQARLDYKKAAKATGNRKIGFPPMDFVLEHTGYVHGANTPIGIQMHHPEYILVIDQSINDYPSVIISSGELGQAVEIAVTDLLELLQSSVVDLLKV